MRSGILSGRLRPGERLPATRDFAQTHRIARGTVVNAFAQLVSEGYLVSRVGSGTCVATDLPDDLLQAPRAKTAATTPAASEAARPARLSRYASRLAPFPPGTRGRVRAFRANIPAFDRFPTTTWARLAGRRLAMATRSLLDAGEPAGYRPLRAAVAHYLDRFRGVRCESEQVVIVSGVQSAIDLAARVLLDPGDRVAMEDPGYVGARLVFRALGAKIVPMPVDHEGASVPSARVANVRLCYVTPANQFPTCVSMSLPRRLALLDWARRSGAYLLEDDYDSEFRYSGRPLPALQGLGDGRQVLFCGSFSKVMFPSLRVGYLVVPPELVDAFSAAHSITQRHVSIIEQAVLADFIEAGHFARHIRRMRMLYAERLDVLTRAVREHLSGRLEITNVEAGLQTVGWLAPGLDARLIVAAAREREVELVAIGRYGGGTATAQGLHMGFAAVEPAELRRGVTELARILDKPRAHTRRTS
jgi:GntR family transcriptional regulator/MocR family aminotransferase